MLVEAEQIERFREDGAVVLRQVFSRDWLELVERGLRRNMEAPSDRGAFADGAARGFFQDSDNWRRIAEFRDFAYASPAKDIVAALMGATKINFIHDHVLVKLAGAGKRTVWHQDQPYSPIDGGDFCTLWLPIDPVTRGNTLEFVAGSHRTGAWYRPLRFATGELREGDDPRWTAAPDIERDPSRFRILGWAMEPGDAVVFSALTLHGAPGNRGAVDRRVLSTRWTGNDARFQRRPGEMSPPPPAIGAPEDGAPLDCEAFPVVWRKPRC
jgi:ectoine hydroxylase-related dioxygenase (phytanoyl-CoA dioxygenase family)